MKPKVHSSRAVHITPQELEALHRDAHESDQHFQKFFRKARTAGHPAFRNAPSR